MNKKYFKFYILVFAALCGVWALYISFQTPPPKDIVFVGSAPLSGPTKHLGVEYSNGIDTYFRYANENGLLGKDRVSLDIYDDQYEPFLTKVNITKAIKQQNVYGVLGVVGTPTAEEAMKIAINEGIPFLMPLTGAEFLYDANHLTFTLRPSYKQEAATMVKYMLAHDIKKVAIVYQNDSFGLTALNAFSKSIAGSGIKLVTEGVYNRNTLSINYALGEIIKYSPQAVIIAGTQKPTVELIKRAEDNKLETLFFNFSFGGYEPIYEEARKKRVNLNKIFITQVVPPLMTNENEDTRAFKTLYAKYHPSSKPNSIAFEGFLAAKTVVSALAKARNSRSDFIKSLSSMQIELAGKKLLYAENDHGGLKDTYLLKLGENGGILVNE